MTAETVKMSNIDEERQSYNKLILIEGAVENAAAC